MLTGGDFPVSLPEKTKKYTKLGSLVPKHVTVIGAGPGVAIELARLFGAEAYEVTLVARSEDRLRSLTAVLEASGIPASYLVADISDHDAFREALRALDLRSPIDVCIFQPAGPSSALRDVLEVTVENVRPNLDLLVLGAVAVIEVLAHRMIERGDGALVFVGGGSSQLPLRAFGNLGVAMSGVRTLARSLDRALRGTGVRSSYLTIAAMVAEVGAEVLSEHQVRVEDVASAIWQLAVGDGSRDVMVSPGAAS